MRGAQPLFCTTCNLAKASAHSKTEGGVKGLVKGAWHETAWDQATAPVTGRCRAKSAGGAAVGRCGRQDARPRAPMHEVLKFEGRLARGSRPQLLATRRNGYCMLNGSGEQGAGRGKPFRAGAGCA